MKNEDIEKLKEAAFAAVELLKTLPHHGSFHGEDRAEIITAVEAFRPKVGPFEAWANFYKGHFPLLYCTAEEAESNAGNGARRVAVHLREVAPVEWERWESVNEKILASGVYQGSAAYPSGAAVICESHNAEMQRITGTEGK